MNLPTDSMGSFCDKQETTVLIGNLVMPARVIPDGVVVLNGERIVAVGPQLEVAIPAGARVIESRSGFIAPGFVDIHVHGGAGADFMDGTPEAFDTITGIHARHGTTSLVPTTTVASEDQILGTLNCTRTATISKLQGARVLGAHFYGPYFGPEARGCHPAAPLRPPCPEEYRRYLDFADCIVTATIALELPGSEQFVHDCIERGIRVNVGHSHATFDQMRAALAWGVRHVDHLFCAMSDRARLRQTQIYPMRGGVLEATLFFDELTTEVISDGKHLAPELLQLALKIKGPDRLAIVTDCNRALDMPDGVYIFGPLEGGEPFLHKDGVGIMPNAQGLASGATGMDHAVRTFVRMTNQPLYEVVRMATLTPARIVGWDDRIGSLAVGKFADVVLLSEHLTVERVFVAGVEVEGLRRNGE